MKRHFKYVNEHILKPLLRLLRGGASPEQLAWSIAIGAVLGLNPLLGSSTVLTVLVIFLLKLNQPAAQIGVHTIYPLQLLLVLPFIRAGSALFGTEAMPFELRDMLTMLKRDPWNLTKLIWRWECHALVIWAALAVVLTPLFALLLTRALRRWLREHRSDIDLPGKCALTDAR